jgi:hypothetical protein
MATVAEEVIVQHTLVALKVGTVRIRQTFESLGRPTVIEVYDVGGTNSLRLLACLEFPSWRADYGGAKKDFHDRISCSFGLLEAALSLLLDSDANRKRYQVTPSTPQRSILWVEW